jgi:hypothetical protein
MISELAFDGRKGKPRIETLRQILFAQLSIGYSAVARTPSLVISMWLQFGN